MTNQIRCRMCGVQKSCGSCFEPTSIAPERLQSGARSALCRPCHAKRTQAPRESVPLDIRMELKNL